MSRVRVWHWILCACLSPVGGCNFSVDEDLISELRDAGSDAQPPDPDAGEDAALSTSGSGSDASHAPEDAELQGADVQPGPVPGGALDAANEVPCTWELDCQNGANPICLEGRCVPRCAAQLGCQITRVSVPKADLNPTWNAVNDGRDTVYYLTDFDSILWRYRLGSTPEYLGRPGAQPLFATPDHVYLAAEDLYRIAQGSSELELVRASVTNAWFSGEHVWWSEQRGAGAELWRTPARGALAPELVGAVASAEIRWLAGSEDWVVRDPLVETAAKQSLIVDLLPALSSARTLEERTSFFLGADSIAVYANVAGDILRYYPDGHAPPARVAPTYNLKLEVSRWGWVYWYTYGAGDPLQRTIGRTHRDKPTTDGVLLGSAPIDGFTALPHTLLYVSRSHLFAKETPLLCDTERPCPQGVSCGSDGTCAF